MTSAAASPTVEALAQRVADLLGPRLEAHLAELLEQQARPPGLVDAAELARILSVTRSFVYENAELLGAYRLGETGDDRKPRLRFDIERARAALAGRDKPTLAPTRTAARPRHAASPTTAPLLPIRGSE